MSSYLSSLPDNARFIFIIIVLALAAAIVTQYTRGDSVTWQQTLAAAKELGFEPDYLNWLVEWDYLLRPKRSSFSGQSYPKKEITKWYLDLILLRKTLGLSYDDLKLEFPDDSSDGSFDPEYDACKDG